MGEIAPGLMQTAIKAVQTRLVQIPATPLSSLSLSIYGLNPRPETTLQVAKAALARERGRQPSSTRFSDHTHLAPPFRTDSSGL